MKKTEKTKKKSRVVPITCFILCLATCGFNGEIAGFFLFLAFITFLFSAMVDPIDKPVEPKGVDVSEDWTPSETGSLFKDSYSTFGCGANPVSCGVTAEVQVSPLAGVGESYTEIT